MSNTAEAAAKALKDLQENKNLAEVSAIVSKNMLLGARGNSGVILSQIFISKIICKAFKNLT